MLDLLARRLGMGPAGLRRRNTIQADELPYDTGFLYRDGNPCVYDSGNFAAALEHALDRAGYDVFRREQMESRRRGVYGAGIAAYVEGTGLGPFESAAVRLDTSGKVVVATGACSQGQGHETTLAQTAADALDAGLDDVTVVGGDTRELAAGVGTYASRSVVAAGNAVAGAVEDRRYHLEARPPQPSIGALFELLALFDRHDGAVLANLPHQRGKTREDERAGTRTELHDHAGRVALEQGPDEVDRAAVKGPDGAISSSSSWTRTLWGNDS